jgi:nucleotide-binding universal stress UspA family protein
VIAHDSSERLLSDDVEDQHVDLTGIGSHGRGAVFDALIGSTAKTLVETLEGDLMIVDYQPKIIGQMLVYNS